MDSSDQSFKKQGIIHETLGGGFVADVVLWKRRDITVGILLAAFAAWLVFGRAGYTPLSLVCNVLLLLIAILFFWAKSAAILNRPAPPLPELHLSEEIVNKLAAFIHSRGNAFLSVSQDIAMGKDSRMFFKVAACLWLVSVVDGRIDIIALAYTVLVIVFTIPVMCERYEDQIRRYVMMGYRELQEFVSKFRKWSLR